ncbi:helix-turn-helix transcriptional regulator [Halobacillus massiliensis]|uniref:helix-turn-helix transcriptional regulator n=1 Tax=Halobacillus massiliensis TaxID=1926286 RepID=UPI0009E273A5|nr:hypothetical protein [Halobacillus massiliensis]
MDRMELNKVVSEKLKLIRIEFFCTQAQMADLIGISKKTLIQVEKGRIFLTWTATIAVCCLFNDSTILRTAVNGSPFEIVRNISFPT